MIDDRATFFDIHRHPQKHRTIQLSLQEFLAKASQGQLFASDTALTECPALPDANRALVLDSNDWINLEIALVWALTGKVADKETVYPYRDVYRSLLKAFGLRNSFRLSVTFAYLMCAARLKRNGWGSEDKNSVDDFSAFCRHLLDPSKAVVPASAFMCAHREADEEDANKLVKKLKTESFVRVINILNGIAHNLEDKSIQLTIYHLDESKYSLLAIFPNIIFKYLESEGLGELLRSLGRHYQEIDQLAQELSTDKVALHLVPTEKHIIDTRALCKKLGGAQWRTLTPFEAGRALSNRHLHEITEVAAMAEVIRYMPEYGAVKANSVNVDYARHVEDKDLMAWYAEQENLTPYAKALYETLFYFNWGQKTRQSDGIAIGIDRDHSDFQVRAFHTGFNDTYAFGSQAPIVYLRRSDRELGKTDIHSLSLRQFWRHSADNKR